MTPPPALERSLRVSGILIALGLLVQLASFFMETPVGLRDVRGRRGRIDSPPGSLSSWWRRSGDGFGPSRLSRLSSTQPIAHLDASEPPVSSLMRVPQTR